MTDRRPQRRSVRHLSGDYQFARRWFAGARFDYSERAAGPSLHDKGGAALLTFWPSEFSQIRGEYRRTSYAEGTTANELLFQFLFAIGAHGAHHVLDEGLSAQGQRAAHPGSTPAACRLQPEPERVNTKEHV